MFIVFSPVCPNLSLDIISSSFLPASLHTVEYSTFMFLVPTLLPLLLHVYWLSYSLLLFCCCIFCIFVCHLFSVYTCMSWNPSEPFFFHALVILYTVQAVSTKISCLASDCMYFWGWWIHCFNLNLLIISLVYAFYPPSAKRPATICPVNTDSLLLILLFDIIFNSGMVNATPTLSLVVFDASVYRQRGT